MYLNKVFKFVTLSIFITSTSYISDIYASEDSSEEAKEPLHKKRKLTKSSDAEIIHKYDPSAPKPTPSAAPKKTTIIDFFKPASSKPLIVEEKVIEAENKPLKDSFHIFNVGQGNSQLAIYTDNQPVPFGVLYDCGSAAQNVHPKISQTRSEGKGFISIVKKRDQTLNDQMQSLQTAKEQAASMIATDDIEIPTHQLVDMDDDGMEIEDASLTDKKSTSRLSIGSSSSDMSYDSDRGARLQNIGDKIKETLLSYHLSYLFVFLSHADKDHINLLKDVIPKGLNTFLILGGNFIQPSETHPERLKEDIQDLFNFIKDRKENVYFSLPYCWEFPQYSQLKEDIKSYEKGITDQTLLAIYEKGWPFHQPKSLYGSLSDFLSLAALYGDTYASETEEQSPNSLLGFLTRMSSVEGSPEESSKAPSPNLSSKQTTEPVGIQFFLQNKNVKRELDNVYIWALSKKSSEANNQSTIVSFRMPSLRKSFICTGDAHEDVWSDIATLKQQQEESVTLSYKEHINSPHALLTSLYDGRQHYTISLLLPHHGAYDNYSPVMLSLLRPHVMIASAGAGMHSHPSRSLIKKLKLTYRADTEWQKQMTDFWKDFEITKNQARSLEYYFLSFTKEENKPQRAYNHHLEEDKLVILCTNTLGDLQFTEDVISTEYSDQIIIDDLAYKVEFKKRVASTEDVLPPSSPAKSPDSFIFGDKTYKKTLNAPQTGKKKDKKGTKNKLTYEYLSEKIVFTEENPGVYVSEKYLIKDGKIYQKITLNSDVQIYESLDDKNEFVLAIQENDSKTYVSKKLLLPTTIKDGEVSYKQEHTGIKTIYKASPESCLKGKITVDRYGNIIYILIKTGKDFKSVEYVVLEGEVYKKKSHKRVMYTSLKEGNKDIIIQVENAKESVYYKGKAVTDEDKKLF